MSDAAEPKTDMELFKELAGTDCRCGAHKRATYSLCGKCYYSLPPHMQQALYARLGKGYREAYEAAADFLDQAKEWK